MILGVDTSSLAASCALWQGERLVGECFSNAGLTHSQTILPMVRALLDSARVDMAQVEGFAVSAGPGSFTGLRIGISAVKGMALALDRPCMGISTLEALAANLLCYRGVIAPVMDARCRQVYTALFRSDGESLERLEPDAALSLEELGRRLEGLGEPVLLVGDGAHLCAGELAELPVSCAPQALLHQRASSVCQLACRRSNWVTAQQLAPAYLRLAQAERERLKKLEG